MRSESDKRRRDYIDIKHGPEIHWISVDTYHRIRAIEVQEEMIWFHSFKQTY